LIKEKFGLLIHKAEAMVEASPRPENETIQLAVSERVPVPLENG
jgi:hypothetical protein